MIKKMAIKMWHWVFGKPKKDLRPPREFALIQYSSQALQNGIKDNSNKIIFKHFINDFGNRTTQKYPYCEERVSALEDQGIPVYDQTLQKVRFPVWARITPAEVVV